MGLAPGEVLRLHLYQNLWEWGPGTLFIKDFPSDSNVQPGLGSLA